MFSIVFFCIPQVNGRTKPPRHSSVSACISFFLIHTYVPAVDTIAESLYTFGNSCFFGSFLVVLWHFMGFFIVFSWFSKIWFYENLEKTRKKDNFQNHEKTMKKLFKNYKKPCSRKPPKTMKCPKSTNFQLVCQVRLVGHIWRRNCLVYSRSCETLPQWASKGTRKIRQVSSMIHSARPTVSTVVNIVCFARFPKVGTDVRTDNMCENNDRDCGSAEWINKRQISVDVEARKLNEVLSQERRLERTLMYGHYVWEKWKLLYCEGKTDISIFKSL